jgi:hypothetical protein
MTLASVLRHESIKRVDVVEISEAVYEAVRKYLGVLSENALDDPRVTSAVSFAARHWTLEENPGMGQQGLFFYYNVMGRALATAGMNAIPRQSGGEAIAWRADLARKVISLQRPDGSWSNPNNTYWENNPVLATAYSLVYEYYQKQRDSVAGAQLDLLLDVYDRIRQREESRSNYRQRQRDRRVPRHRQLHPRRVLEHLLGR